MTQLPYLSLSSRGSSLATAACMPLQPEICKGGLVDRHEARREEDTKREAGRTAWGARNRADATDTDVR
jgi:hypothetical protein